MNTRNKERKRVTLKIDENSRIELDNRRKCTSNQKLQTDIVELERKLSSLQLETEIPETISEN